jgi:hypothetical protein
MRAVSGRRPTVKITLPPGTEFRVTGTAQGQDVVRRRQKPLKVGKKGRMKLTPRLTKQGNSMLRAAGRLDVTLSITITGSDGEQVTLTRLVTFTR